jgi:hypothetical protein
MLHIVHAHAERALYMSKVYLEYAVFAHDSHLVTNSALPNPCARNGSHTTDEHVSNVCELRYITPDDEPSISITVFSTQQPSLVYACQLVYIVLFPLAHKTGTTPRSSSH